MSYIDFLANRIAANTTKINSIQENAKENQEFDNQEILEDESKIRISFQGSPFYITIGQLIQASLDLAPSITPQFETIYFGAGAYQNTAGNSTTSSEFAAHINNVGFTITEGKIAIINITVKRQVDGHTVMAKERYYFKKNNTPGTWGSNSDNGEVSFSDFIFDSQTVVTLIYDYTVVRDLGDIGNNTIVDYVNNALSPNQSLQSGNNYLFTCVRSGVREIYEFKGTLPVTIGATSPDDDVEVQDFDLLHNENSQNQTFLEERVYSSVLEPTFTDQYTFQTNIARVFMLDVTEDCEFLPPVLQNSKAITYSALVTGDFNIDLSAFIISSNSDEYQGDITNRFVIDSVRDSEGNQTDILSIENIDDA